MFLCIAYTFFSFFFFAKLPNGIKQFYPLERTGKRHICRSAQHYDGWLTHHKIAWQTVSVIRVDKLTDISREGIWYHSSREGNRTSCPYSHLVASQSLGLSMVTTNPIWTFLWSIKQRFFAYNVLQCRSKYVYVFYQKHRTSQFSKSMLLQQICLWIRKS